MKTASTAAAKSIYTAPYMSMSTTTTAKTMISRNITTTNAIDLFTETTEHTDYNVTTTAKTSKNHENEGERIMNPIWC